MGPVKSGAMKRFPFETGDLRGRWMPCARLGDPAGCKPSRTLAWLVAGLVALAAGPVRAGEPAELVVGTSGDYAPFSVAVAGPGFEPSGFGPELVAAFAAERGLALRFVAFSWPDLTSDLREGRFDLAAGGITVRPERGLVGRFTVPVATSGAVVLVPAAAPAGRIDDLDRPDATIGVNRGGHLERVTRAHLRHARIEAIPDNAAVLPALQGGRVDAVVTDTLEAPHWRALEPGLRVLGPFTRDRKAFLVAADRDELAADLDAWLIEREADGTLARLRARHLGDAQARPARPAPRGAQLAPHDQRRAPAPPRPASAAPLGALLAAIDERLALMPLVAEAKRASGGPVDVPEREQRVLDAAVASVRGATARTTGAEAGATRAHPADPSRERAVRSLFRAQIEAAKAIQRRALERPPLPGPGPDAAPPQDLDTEIRPALIRIGDRIARLVVALPADLDPVDTRSAAQRELAGRDLDDAHLTAIADAIVAVSRTSAQ